MRRLFVLPYALLWALCSPTWLGGCSLDSDENRPKAVVIGIDGADWKLIDAIAAEGRMPNLTALRERGASGPIDTLVDFPLSPVIWTSVVTGKTPAKHGITWFLVDQPDGTRVPVRSHNRRVKAIWNILAEQGRRTTAVGWWATYPAEDVGEGTIVSDALGFHGFGRTARDGDDGRKTHPPDRFAELDALVPPEQQVSVEFVQRFLHLTPEQVRGGRFDPARHPKRDPGNPLHLFQQYAVTAQGYTAIAEKLLGEPSDLFLLYYEQIDSLSHLFMKHTAPRLEWISEEDHAFFKDAVTEWYAYQDDLLGRVLAKIDLDTTAVFVLSDHGFKSGERRIRSEQTVDVDTAHLDHEPDGIFLVAGPGIRSGTHIADASVLDIAPTLLHYLGLAVGKDMDGKVLTGIFEEESPISYVTSYETEPKRSPAEEVGDNYDEDYDKADPAKNLAGLEALGYMRKAEAAGVGASGESSPELHDNLARIHIRTGDLDEAAAEFEKALALNAHDADALLGLSGIAASQGNHARAEHLAKVALATNPDFPPALAQLADLRRDAGDLGECTRLYREAIGLHDSMPAFYLGLGDCLQRADRYEEAEAAFTRVLELDPDSYAAVYNLGVTASRQGREEGAIAHYERALEMDPQHPLVAATFNNLGTVHLDRGEIEQAVERWEQAVEASPTQFEARYNLATQYLDQNRVDDAIPLLEEAARLAPNHETLHTRLGRAYMEKGRGEDAFRALSLVRRLYPENWFAPLGMAVLLAATERPEQAKPLLDDALRLGGDIARATAAVYPALAPLLDEKAFPLRQQPRGTE
jgi:tetratricopeptide (TPR) repeat protein